MVGKHLIYSVKLQRPCLYICKMINPNFRNCTLNCCQAFEELVSSTCCKIAQARLKLQVHGKMQNKHIAVLFRASVQ